MKYLHLEAARWPAEYVDQLAELLQAVALQLLAADNPDYKAPPDGEEEARRIRASAGGPIRSLGHPGGLTQAEVAAILAISVRAVREIEQRAIEKLRHHPALRRLWREYLTGQVEESSESSSEG